VIAGGIAIEGLDESLRLLEEVAKRRVGDGKQLALFLVVVAIGLWYAAIRRRPTRP
jgi:uncharacterized membrane protein YidH (DUF202 family)